MNIIYNQVFVWESDVRAYEIDAQGILNHACYLNYFDNARTLMIKALGINWVEWSAKGYHLVVSASEIRFIKPLKAFDHFIVETVVTAQGRLRKIFQQALYLIDEQGTKTLMCQAKNTIVCVDEKNNKPIPVETVDMILNK